MIDALRSLAGDMHNMHITVTKQFVESCHERCFDEFLACFFVTLYFVIKS